MIEGICHTNLDEYCHETWPEQFVAVPKINSKIQSKSGKTLRVCGITHCSKTDEQYVSEIAFIKIELTKSSLI
jgi:hypothetical protein